ncbi:hypothetical protein [Arthrobacter sp. EPSL27]|uniref:hypothetical protein n=1 Tax=Arthrobacter sp. EPSL27 TaxID=1745378 RepID=UPI002F4055E0
MDGRSNVRSPAAVVYVVQFSDAGGLLAGPPAGLGGADDVEGAAVGVPLVAAAGEPGLDEGAGPAGAPQEQAPSSKSESIAPGTAEAPAVMP